MKIEQIYTGCLNEAAYFIESNGEAAVLDPLRDIDVYLTRARELHARITYIFLTQLHSDFITGHLELSRQTGATIVLGPGTDARFRYQQAAESEEYAIGDLRIKAIHTPGYAVESTSYLLRQAGKPVCIFSGYTLLIGDVGTPDISRQTLSAAELSALMYRTIHNFYAKLPEELVVYPTYLPHTSSTGEAIERSSTIAQEKRTNRAFTKNSQEEFISWLTAKIQVEPAHGVQNVRKNREGYLPLEDVFVAGMKPLSTTEFKEKSAYAVVLDCRDASVFASGFIPGSVQVGLNGTFGLSAAAVLPYDASVILITEPGTEKEAITRLARIGIDRVEGYLAGGFHSWTQAGEPIDMIISVEADELAMDFPFDDNMVIIDVRSSIEYAQQHIAGAIHIPLRELTDVAQIASMEDFQNLYIHGTDTYQSSTAVSLFKRQGYHNIRCIADSWQNITLQESLPFEKSAELLN